MKSKKFKFGDKVNSIYTGNAVFYKYNIRDKQYPQYNAEVFIDSQNESMGIEASELKRGWGNAYK